MVLGLYPYDLFDQRFCRVLPHWQDDLDQNPKLR